MTGTIGPLGVSAAKAMLKYFLPQLSPSSGVELGELLKGATEALMMKASMVSWRRTSRTPCSSDARLPGR